MSYLALALARLAMAAIQIENKSPGYGLDKQAE